MFTLNINQAQRTQKFNYHSAVFLALHYLPTKLPPAITTLPLPRSNYDPYKHQHYLTKPLQAITIPPQYPLTPCMLSQYNNMLLLLSATATQARPPKDTIMLRHLYKYAYYYCLAILCIICTPPCQHITCTIPPNNYCPMICSHIAARTMLNQYRTCFIATTQHTVPPIAT